MLTILVKSVHGKNLRNFRTFKWNSSNQLPDTATKTFWQVRTLMHQFKFIEVMKMKQYFGELPLTEMKCLYDAPGYLTDQLFVELLLAKQKNIPEDILLQRLNFLQKLTGRRIWSKNLYFSQLGNLNYELHEFRQAIRKANKYSGYVRNSSAVGSKRSNRISIPEPEIVEWSLTEELDFFHFLTVGEFSSGTSGKYLFTLTKDQKSETVNLSRI